MTLVHQIIKDAYRESNIIAVSQVPTLDEQNEALTLLDRYVAGVFGNEAGNKLQAVDLPAHYLCLSSHNKRFMVQNETSMTLDAIPQDGSRFGVVDMNNAFDVSPFIIYGNGRKIEGEDLFILDEAGANLEFFYRADLGEWKKINPLKLDDEFPFPREFEDMFVIALATRINPRNGVSVDEQAMMNFRRSQRIFRTRYSQTQEMPSEDGLLRLTGTHMNRLSDTC